MTSPGQPSPDTATATRAATAGDRRFAAVVRHVLGIEGGHSKDAADRGGETNFGISLRFLKAEGRLDLNGDGIADYDLDLDGDIDGADVRLLSPDDAVALYRRCFWDRLGLDRVPAPFDAMLFDQAVNGGAVAAVKMLQKALNSLSMMAPAAHLAVDGRLGAMTRLALVRCIQQQGSADLAGLYRINAVNRYTGICQRDPSQRRFLGGWTRRAQQLGHV